MIVVKYVADIRSTKEYDVTAASMLIYYKLAIC